MLHIAICDDQNEQIEIISNAVKSFENQFGYEFELTCFNSSFLLIEELENGANFDILLLDICMPGILGTDVAKTVRKRKDKTEIIFLTTSDEFAVDAFALKAVHYIIKPFSQDDFDDAMNRAIPKIVEKSVNIKIKNGIMEVDINEIFYIESHSHTQNVFLDKDVIETRESMAELIARLQEISNQFISPCKGYIINLAKVKQLTKKEVILKNGSSVPVSTRLYATVKNAYFDFRFGENK